MYKKFEYNIINFASNSNIIDKIITDLSVFSEYFTVTKVTSGLSDCSSSAPVIKFTPLYDTGHFFALRVCQPHDNYTPIRLYRYLNNKTSYTERVDDDVAMLSTIEVFTNETRGEFFLVFNGCLSPFGIFKAMNDEYVAYFFEKYWKNGTKYAASRILANGQYIHDPDICYITNAIPSWSGYASYYPLCNVYSGVFPMTLFRNTRIEIEGTKYVGIASPINDSGIGSCQGCIFRYTNV